jgi:hypothetical protein
MLEYLITVPSCISSSSEINSQISNIASLKASLITCIVKKNLVKIGRPYQKLLK